MATAAKVSANRRNAEKSTGPRTAEGKAVVAQNAVKHGLWARQAVIKDEDPQEFELHRRRMLDRLAPDGPDQQAMAERIVALWWRLKRAERMQDEALDYLIEADRGDDWVKHLRSEGDPSARVELRFGRAVARDFANARTLDRLTMHERRIESSLYRSMNDLQRLQLRRKADGGQCLPDKGEPARDESDCVKQSQSPAEDGGGTCTVAMMRPVETQHLASPQSTVTDGPCYAKQSQSPEGGGAYNPPDEACAVPVETSVETKNETQDVASLQEEAPARLFASTKQSQPPAEDGGGTCAVHMETPVETQHLASPQRIATNGPGCAKQSQSEEVSSLKCEVSSGARVLPRAVRRVAWHYHNVSRSY